MPADKASNFYMLDPKKSYDNLLKINIFKKKGTKSMPRKLHVGNRINIMAKCEAFIYCVIGH